jgi:hypothetical protein
MPAGRPSNYHSTIADALCDEIAIGRSVLQICESPEFPSERTVYRWLETNEEFRQKYARAREFQAEHYAAEIIKLADTPVIAEKITIKADGSEERVIGDAVDRTRVQIDARKWYASKVAPKSYGDKLEHTGPEGGPIQIISTIPRPPKE